MRQRGTPGVDYLRPDDCPPTARVPLDRRRRVRTARQLGRHLVQAELCTEAPHELATAEERDQLWQLGWTASRVRSPGRAHCSPGSRGTRARWHSQSGAAVRTVGARRRRAPDWRHVPFARATANEQVASRRAGSRTIQRVTRPRPSASKPYERPARLHGAGTRGALSMGSLSGTTRLGTSR